MPRALIPRHTDHSILLPGFPVSSHTGSGKPHSTSSTICFIVHLRLRCTWVVFSEMGAHTPMGNNFRRKRLFLAPFAFSLRLCSFPSVLRSASFSPSPFSESASHICDAICFATVCIPVWCYEITPVRDPFKVQDRPMGVNVTIRKHRLVFQIPYYSC